MCLKTTTIKVTYFICDTILWKHKSRSPDCYSPSPYIVCIYIHTSKKFCITSVPQVPEALHTNGIEIHTNNISALFIRSEERRVGERV